MAAPARGWSALLLKALWILVLQAIASFCAHIVFQKGWLNDQALIGLFMFVGSIFFWFYFPYSRIAYTFLTCRDVDIMVQIMERVCAFQEVIPLIGFFGMLLNVVTMGIGAVWFFQSFSLSAEDILENAQGMAVVALIVFLLASLGAIIYKLFGPADELSSSVSIYAIKRAERLILGSIATLLIHRGNEIGMFSDVFLAGGVMIFLSASVIYVSLNRDFSVMLTETKGKCYYKISGSIIWILIGIWYLILSLTQKVTKLDSSIYLIVIVSVFGIDFLIGLVPDKLFQLSAKDFWDLCLFVCNWIFGFDPDNGGADNGGADNGVHGLV